MPETTPAPTSPEAPVTPTHSTADQPAPRGLDALALCFMLLGGLAAYETLVSFLQATIPSINFLVVFILIGIGLKRRTAWARTWALRCAAFVFCFYLGSAAYKILNKVEMQMGDKILFGTMTLLALIASGWALYTLNRPSIKARFSRRVEP